MEHKKNTILRYLLCLFALVSGLILLTDVYLMARGRGGLCSTSGCKVASTMLSIREPLLILAGACLYLFLFLLFFFEGRYEKKILSRISWLLIYASLAFDGVLIGHLIKTHTLCYLCISMAISLFLLLIFYSLYKSSPMALALGTAIWLSSLSATYILKPISPPPPRMEKGIMIHIPSRGVAKFRANLFVSLHCIHCYHLLYNLAHLKKKNDVEWNIYFLASSPEDKERIAHMLADKDLKEHPFKVILKYRDMEKVGSIPIPPYVEKRLKATQLFFKWNRFQGVPLLIATSPSVKMTIMGVREIARFLLEEKIVKKWYFFREVPRP